MPKIGYGEDVNKGSLTPVLKASGSVGFCSTAALTKMLKNNPLYHGYHYQSRFIRCVRAFSVRVFIWILLLVIMFIFILPPNNPIHTKHVERLRVSHISAHLNVEQFWV